MTSAGGPARDDLDARVVRLVRVVAAAYALPSYPLALVLMFAPGVYSGRLGLGGNPFAEAVYGGAVMGEALLFTAAARAPRRYAVFFEYVAVYKAFALVGGAFALATQRAPAPAAYAVLAGWAVAGLGAAVVSFRARSAGVYKAPEDVDTRRP